MFLDGSLVIEKTHPFELVVVSVDALPVGEPPTKVVTTTTCPPEVVVCSENDDPPDELVTLLV